MLSSELSALQNIALFGSDYSGQEAYFSFQELLHMVHGVRPHGKALDVGSGNGAITCRLAIERALTVVGIEKDLVRLSLARQNAFLSGVDHQVSFVHLDMDYLRGDALDTYDLIYSLDALQFSQDLRMLVNMLAERLPDRGIMVGTLWCCGDEQLSARWGFPRPYAYDDVVSVFSALKRRFTHNVQIDFADRFRRYYDFLTSYPDDLCFQLGKESYIARLDLIFATIHAIEQGCLAQMIFSTHSPHLTR